MAIEKTSDRPAVAVPVDVIGREIGELKDPRLGFSAQFRTLFAEYQVMMNRPSLSAKQMVVRLVVAHKNDFHEGKGEALYLWLRQLYRKYWPDGRLDDRISIEISAQAKLTGARAQEVITGRSGISDRMSGDYGNGDRITQECMKQTLVEDTSAFADDQSDRRRGERPTLAPGEIVAKAVGTERPVAITEKKGQ